MRGPSTWTRGTRLLLAATVSASAIAGCGSSSSSLKPPAVAAAHPFKLAGFQPASPVRPGTPTTISFVIQQPSGKPLTSFKTGAGPHTGVHLIIVRDDLSTIIHQHPPIGPGGKISQRVTLPAPGRYRVLIDVYPNLSQTLPNFQLFASINATGRYTPQKLPAFKPLVNVSGYRFALHGHPKLKALQPTFLTVTVTDPSGRKASFQPWFGALAHAIFFRTGSLDYFHTHVCGAGAANCTSVLGPSKVTGRSTTPGKLTVGVLVPVPGIWRLFLQTKVNGQILTAPYTLKVG